ncbi:STAS domain-containing protein [Actinoplanes sp. NPDC049802]|uniref:STAS domain-containing protein n=1 Tax=Actinoplanes sp. NPDC049802 TaxID=3154742 RepID=UPI0033FE80C9
MTGLTVDVETTPDGVVVIRPHGNVGPGDAGELRRTLVYAVRRIRPVRLVLDLHDVTDLDPLNLGALAAACHLGDDQHVPVFLEHCSTVLAGLLSAAGVPHHRLRRQQPKNSS